MIDPTFAFAAARHLPAGGPHTSVNVRHVQPPGVGLLPRHRPNGGVLSPQHLPSQAGHVSAQLFHTPSHAQQAAALAARRQPSPPDMHRHGGAVPGHRPRLSPWPLPAAIPKPGSLQAHDDLQYGSPAAQRKAEETLRLQQERYRPLCRQLPRIGAHSDISRAMDSVCGQLQFGNPAKPPALAIGELHGSTTTVTAVEKALHAMTSHGHRGGALLMELSEADMPQLARFEAMGRTLAKSLGSYKPGLFDALTHQIMQALSELAREKGRHFEPAEFMRGARQFATDTLAIMRAKDAGFEVVPMDLKEDEPMSKREAHMCKVYDRYKHKPVIMVTGGLHTNALLHHMDRQGKGNFAAFAYAPENQPAGLSAMVRRSWHQRLLDHPKYLLAVVAPEVAFSDPYAR